MVRFPRVRAWLEQLLHTHDTPTRTAAAYAVGVFFGFSPLLGLHTVLGLTVGFALNLNRVAVLLGIYSNLPWILVPYYSLATWLGATLLGVEAPPGVTESILDALQNRSWTEFRSAAATLTPFLRAFAVGSTIGATILAIAAFRVTLAIVSAHHRHRQRLQNTEL